MSVGHYENFPVASRLVPARLRGAVVALYRFARAADDLADEGDASPEARLAALAAYDRALAEIAAGGTPPDPPFPALAAAVRAHGLPLSPLHDLVAAFRQDVTVVRYATYADLVDYCRRSANPVGRLLLALYRAETPANGSASDAICTGLQLTNFWQDVASDWERGRVYLPQEDLARFGVAEESIRARRADGRWRALMAFETARARALLQSGRPLARALPFRLGLELSAVIEGGLRILARIDAVGGDVFARRPVLTARDWCAVAYHALVSTRTAAA
ncbi:MAG: squalene synthase HpnC [Betaproteobacteria bacterium]|nr:squalene synthase HpnC [Betaproteobacteria bacterium]